ncbi:MAG: STAS domain-containing protein [Oscillospiraceae bacterium]|nr:STAS domain-containing protein [Oscillospiraceae bacterium]
MNITKKSEGSQTTLELDGRVDTNTSPKLQEAILDALKTAKLLVLDFSKVGYLSSAGLRALLIGQKTAAGKGAKMELHSPAPTVMTVLDTVGFSKMLTIT